jgi:hypothetical protein
MDSTGAPGPGRGARESEFGARRLFLADSRIALAILNYARYRTLERLLGVSREQANVVSVILALGAADAAYETGRRIARGPVLPSAGDTAIGAIALRDAALSLVGPADRKTPLLGTLLAVAMLGGVALPVLRRATARLRAAEHRVREQRIGRYRAATRSADG